MSNDNKAIQDTTFNTNVVTPEYLTKMNELCEKVAENPERHEAFLMQDDVGYIIPVSRILEITAEKHKQEIADFQRRYDECVRRFNEADVERVRLRDEVAAKDAEILSLKSKIDEYERQPELMADVATKALELLKRQDAEIASLRLLAGELTDALDAARSCVTEFADPPDEWSELINKAKEALHGQV